MSTSNTIFSGNSRYATDFQQILDRSVAIASLSLTQLNSQRTALNDQSTAMRSLEAKFAALQTALANLETSAGLSSYSASVSNSEVAAASVSEGIRPGAYTLEVVSTGTFASAVSHVSLTDEAVAGIGTFTLTANGEEHQVEPSTHTLAGLADAINALTDAGVQATVFNVGTADEPVYRLSLESTRLNVHPLDLSAGAGSLVDGISGGSPATYRINGQPPEGTLESDSRRVNLAPGLTAELRETGLTTITVSRGSASISNALSAFVTAFNNAVDELDKHRGTSSGVLRGQSVLYRLSGSLRGIASYSTGADGLSSLTALGLSFTQEGKLSFNTGEFTEAVADGTQGLVDFLGSRAGSGFLKHAAGILEEIEDSTDGAISLEINSLTSRLEAQDRLIEENESRIASLRESLAAQMAAADALIASLEQQANYLNGMFESMRIAAESYR